MKIPDKFLERMRSELGDEFESFVKCYEEKPYMALRVNTLKISSEDFKKTFDFCGEKVAWCENGFYYEDGASPRKLGRSFLFPGAFGHAFGTACRYTGGRFCS